MPKRTWIIACILAGIILISVAYGQYNTGNTSEKLSIGINVDYGKSNVEIIQKLDNSSNNSTIIRAVARANFTLIDGSISFASGNFTFLFDGVVKKTEEITSQGAKIFVNSTEIENWDAGNYTNHTLTFQIINGSVTVRLPNNNLESRSISKNNSSLRVIVETPVKKTGSIIITIDHTKIDSPLTDFPLMIHLPIGNPVLEELSWANRTKFELTQWGQQLYVEIESWDTSGAILWVKVPLISSTFDTILTLNYNSSRTSNTEYIGDTLDPTTPNVWSNGYVSVFHLNGNAYDSASTRNHGTIQGGVTWVEGPNGEPCARFDGSSGVIVVPDNPYYSSVNNGDKLSEECWISPERINWKDYISPLGKGSAHKHETKWNLDGGSTGAWKYYILNNEGSYGSGARSSPIEGLRLAPTRIAGNWYMIHGQIIGDLIALYEGPGIPGIGSHGVGGDINETKGWNDYTKGQGVPDGTRITPSDSSSSYYIGRYGGYNPEWQSQDIVPIRIYEVRISAINRSIAWMKADYYSQLNQLIKLN
jgi:hypothetical protein